LKRIEEVAKDIVLYKNFLDKKYCSDLIKAADNLDMWDPLDDDPVPGLEIRVNLLPGRLRAIFEERAVVMQKVAEMWWEECFTYGVRDAFLIKYSLDTQKSLRLHNDHSLVSGSIKLNDNYSGGVLNFPRQNYNNKDQEVGDLIMWPGQVTHAHESTEIEEGVKYSLTIWTKRHEDDT